MPKRRRPPSSARRRIRELFRGRHASYDAAEVPALIGIPRSTLQEAIANGAFEAHAAIPWEDVVALGLDHRWTLRTVTEALQGGGLAALPPLVRTVAGRVVLPRHQWQILRFLAAERSRTERRELNVSDLLEEAVSTALLTQIHDWDPLEALLPGVRAAAAWPSSE